MKGKLLAIITIALIFMMSCTQYVFVPIPDLDTGNNGGSGSDGEIDTTQIVEEFNLADIVTKLAEGEAIPGVSVAAGAGTSLIARTNAADTLATIDAVLDGYETQNFTYKGNLSIRFLGADSAINSFEVDLNVTAFANGLDESFSMSGTAIPGTIGATVSDSKINVTEDAVLGMGSSSTIMVAGEPVQASGISGNGLSLDNAYAFSSADELLSFAVSVNNGSLDTDGLYFALDNSIDLSGIDWEPIGTAVRSSSEITGTPFKGYFDGKGKSITGLTINTDISDDTGVGFFSALDGATVTNLSIQGTLSASSSGNAGMFAGLMVNDSVISNCTVLQGSSINASEAGGLVGRMMKSGIIEKCKNYADITGTGKIGGIVSAAYYDQHPNAEAEQSYTEFRITNCENHGDIKGGTGNIGGIVGLMGPVDVSGCINTGNITAGNATAVGGLVGDLRAGGSVVGSTNNGNITLTGRTSGTYGVGGLVGWIRYLNDSNNTYHYYRVAEISDSHNTGNISTDGGTGIGGAIGVIYNAATISDSTNTGTVTLSSTDGLMIGGFIGAMQYEEDANDTLNARQHIAVTNCSTAVEDAEGNPIVNAPENTTNEGAFVGHPFPSSPITVTFTGCTPDDEDSGIPQQEA